MRSLPLFAALLPLALAGGCVIHDHGDPEPVPVEYNAPPYIEDVAAGCYWDDVAFDDIWYFEADVSDPNGVYDVVSVWADVYDEFDGTLVQSFELYPSDDPYFWFSDWYGSSTPMVCGYPDYTVDIVAYDSYDDYDVVTVWAAWD